MQTYLLPIISKLTVLSVIDILAMAILIYQFAMIIRGRRAAHIVTGIGVLMVIYVVAAWARLDLLRSVLSALAPYAVFAVIVMFQSEIRRLLSRIGRFRWLAIVVSEETGQMAIASRGDLEPDISMERLQELLTRHTTRKSAAAEAAEPRWKQAEP